MTVEAETFLSRLLMFSYHCGRGDQVVGTDGNGRGGVPILAEELHLEDIGSEDFDDGSRFSAKQTAFGDVALENHDGEQVYRHR